MIINPSNTAGAFKFVVSNVNSTRPTANYGTAVAFSLNAKGSWTQILSGSDISTNCYLLYISFHSLASSAVNRSSLADIGIDTSGGTNYTPLIEDLSASMCTNLLTLGGGNGYTFPIFIPAGSSLAVRGAVAQTAGSCYVRVTLFGRPTNLESLVYGTSAETLGRNGTAIQGTTLTGASAATTSKSPWTSMGTTTKRWKSLQVGFGVHATTVQAAVTRIEVGYGSGSSIDVVQPLCFINSSAAEQLSIWQPQCDCDIPIGSEIFVRMQSSVSFSNSSFAIVTGIY